MTSKEISRRNFLKATALAGAGVFLPRMAPFAQQEKSLAFWANVPPPGEQGITSSFLPWDLSVEREPFSLVSRQAVDKLRRIVVGFQKQGDGEETAEPGEPVEETPPEPQATPTPEPTPEPTPKPPTEAEKYPPVERFPLKFFVHPQIDREVAKQMETEVEPWMQTMFDVIRQAGIPELNKNVAYFREAMEKGKQNASFDSFYLWANPTVLKDRAEALDKEWSPFDHTTWVKRDNTIDFYFVIRPEFKKPYALPNSVFTISYFNISIEVNSWRRQLIMENIDETGLYDGSKLKTQMDTRKRMMDYKVIRESLLLYPKLMTTGLVKNSLFFQQLYQREFGKLKV